MEGLSNASYGTSGLNIILIFVSTLITCVLMATARLERYYEFEVGYMDVTRLGVTKPLVAVNNLFPGPTIYANEDERLLIKVTNNADYDVSIHWHGVRQILSAWADGPSFITQCPLAKGESYLYNFTMLGQTGTLFWHAHTTWLRATVYGAIVVYPNYGIPYPFEFPFDEHIILLGEWWNTNVEQIESTIRRTGGAPELSDAYTINGLPGPLYRNSHKDVFKMKVIPGMTYLLRIVNAALNIEFFFSIANHNLVVVEVDGEYTKPYTTDAIMLTPGQSANVLVTADQRLGQYLVSAGPYISNPGPFPFVKTPATAILDYEGTEFTVSLPIAAPLPRAKDTQYAQRLSTSIRSLKPDSVPRHVDRTLFLAIGLALLDCGEDSKCLGPNGTRFASTINNISFALPPISVQQAYYHKIPGVYTTDFPDHPGVQFNYTGEPLKNIKAERGTRISVIPFNSNVQIVLQDTSFISFENHPIHLHGYSFYVVGMGFGNFDPETANFNLVDPPLRNTVGVPSGGWAAIRFKADNPGVWYLHCHLEVHTTWGLAMAFLVTNGNGPDETLPPPPPDLPKCKGSQHY